MSRTVRTEITCTYPPRASRRRSGLPITACMFVCILFTMLTVARPASAEPRVELVTVGNGDALWARFGHAGLRLVDEDRNLDVMFNYGVAPFGTPEFLWGFVRGEAPFMLEVEPFALTVAYYMAEDRSILTQHLNLTGEQVDQIERFLWWNALPENRDYFYDHFYDNCTTRIRDVLDDATGGAVQTAVGLWTERPRLRTLTMEGVSGPLAYELALEIVSGPNQEERADGWLQLYLPDRLARAVSEAVVPNPEGGSRALGGEVKVVYTRQGPPPAYGHPYLARFILFAFSGVVLLFAFAFSGRRRLTPLRVMAACLCFMSALISGALGILYWALGFVSRIPDTHWNESAAVFLPLDWWLLAGAVALGRGRAMGRWLTGYLVLKGVGLVVYVGLKPLGVMVQDNWPMVALSGSLIAALLFSHRRAREIDQARFAGSRAAPAPTSPSRGSDTP